MSLAGSFGDQAYVCNKCGHGMALYAPHCPKCLNRSLTRVKQDRQLRGAQATTETAEERPKGRSVVSYAIVAAVLALLAIGYYKYTAPKDESVATPGEFTKPTDPAPVTAVPKHAVKHLPRAATTTSSKPPGKARNAASPSGPAPRAAAPMKLWQSTQGDDSSDP